MISGRTRNILKWATALALWLALALLFAVLTLYQAAAESPAKEGLRRAVVALTEIDALVDRHYDDMQARAESIEDDERLTLPQYPIDVPLTRDEVLGRSRDDIRATVLERSTDAIYREGTSVLREDDAGFERFSAAGAVDASLEALRDDVHVAAGVALVLLAVLSIALAAALASLCRGYGRLASSGAVLFALGAPAALLAALARLSADSGGEYVRAQFLAIADEMAWIAVRNGIAFAALGAAMIAIAAPLARWMDTRSSSAMQGALE